MLPVVEPPRAGLPRTPVVSQTFPRLRPRHRRTTGLVRRLAARFRRELIRRGKKTSSPVTSDLGGSSLPPTFGDSRKRSLDHDVPSGGPALGLDRQIAKIVQMPN